MMNPANSIKLLAEFQRFSADHPRAVAFLQSLAQSGIREGSVIEMKVVDPSGEEKICNFRVLDKDVAMVELLKELGRAT